MLALFSLQVVLAGHRSSSKNNWILNRVLSQVRDEPNGGMVQPHFPPHPGTVPATQERAAGSDSVLLAWNRGYSSSISSPNDLCSSVCVDPQDGSVYVVGSSYSQSKGFDYLVIKYSANGDSLWSRRFDGNAHADDYAIAATLGPSRSLYVTGFSMDTDSIFDYVTVKYSPTGLVGWMRKYDGTGQSDDTPIGVVTDPSENVYIIGNSVGADSTYDIATIKYTPSGGQQWVVRYTTNSAEDDIAVGVVVDYARNICIAGNGIDINGYSHFVTLKYNTSGTQLWASMFDAGGAQTCEIAGIAVDGAGNVGVTGKIYSDLSDYDYYTIEYGPAGTQLWSARYDDNESLSDEPTAIGFDSHGSVYVTGSIIGADGTYDYASIKYDNTGSVKWTEIYSVANTDDIPFLLAIDPLDNLYISGTSSNGGNSYDFATVKYNSSGKEQWVTYFNNTANVYDYPTDIQLDQSANLYLCGVSTSHGVNAFNTLKYSQYPNLVFNNREISFPSTEVGCAVRDTIIAYNTGSTSLNVSSMSIPLADYLVFPSNATIPPVGSQEFVVTFSPLSSGDKSADIGLRSNGVLTPVTLNVKGAGVGSGSGVNISATLGTGWQMLSLPVKVNCTLNLNGPLPFAYADGYRRSGNLVEGIGYWTILSSPEVAFNGYEIFQETLQVSSKWNLIGSISAPISISQLRSIPDEIISSKIFGYTSAGYFAADTIYPCHAYWIKVAQAGQLILSTSLPSVAGRFTKSTMPDQNYLKFTDASGKIQRLYFSELDDNFNVAQYELPPLPPNGAFDVRFASGRNLESLPKGLTSEFSIMISAAQYPLIISWDTPNCREKVLLKIGDEILDLDRTGNVSVPSRTSVALIGQALSTLPNQFVLSQNYPNPFNPATKIHFELPANSHVSLKIVDLLGREVATLIDEEKVAGSYNYEFDASNLSSGLYFYRMSAGDFVQVRKMAVIR
jgi:hypothetical protein